MFDYHNVVFLMLDEKESNASGGGSVAAFIEYYLILLNMAEWDV